MRRARGQRGRKAKGNARSGVRKAKAALSEDESVQRGQRQYKGRCPCVRMHGAPATSAGTPRRLRAQEPRPATSIKAGAPASPAWGLRRTAVGRAPRATSTPPRAAPPRLASYNGTVGGTVGRASRARLSTPRQPTPLLSGTCLTSAGRPPLRGMLATEGPGHPEGYPGPVEARYALSELRRISILGRWVNKGNEAGPELLRPGPALLLPPHPRSRSSSENSLTSAMI